MYKLPTEIFTKTLEDLDARWLVLSKTLPLAVENFELIKPFIDEFTSAEATQARNESEHHGYFSQFMSGDAAVYGLYGATPELFDRVLEELRKYLVGSSCDTRSQSITFDLPGLRFIVSTPITEDDLFTLMSLGKVHTVQNSETYQTIVCESL